MNAQDFIYDSIFKQALKLGASERSAKDYAVIGVEKWRRGQFTTAVKLVSEMIANAKEYKKK